VIRRPNVEFSTERLSGGDVSARAILQGLSLEGVQQGPGVRHKSEPISTGGLAVWGWLPEMLRQRAAWGRLLDARAFSPGMDVTDTTFDTAVIKRSAEVPVVVDFWAEWCGPCRMLTPVLEREVAAREGTVELVKVDVDANPVLSEEYAIRGIPAVKAFRNGRVVNEFVGAQAPQTVAAFLDSLTQPSEGEELLARLRETGDDAEIIAALDAGDPERRDELRRLALAIFEELGPEHPATQAHRRRLATILF
jgi:thioredoxin